MSTVVHTQGWLDHKLSKLLWPVIRGISRRTGMPPQAVSQSWTVAAASMVAAETILTILNYSDRAIGALFAVLGLAMTVYATWAVCSWYDRYTSVFSGIEDHDNLSSRAKSKVISASANRRCWAILTVLWGAIGGISAAQGQSIYGAILPLSVAGLLMTFSGYGLTGSVDPRPPGGYRRLRYDHHG